MPDWRYSVESIEQNKGSKSMIFTMDVGNTNIKMALFDKEEMVGYWRLSTTRKYTSDEMGSTLMNLFSMKGFKVSDVDGVMLSSVVPTINFTVEHMFRDYFDIEPMYVAPGIKTSVDIKYENPRELGSDRICNAVAAANIYGGPCVYIDFGTATTFGVLDEKNAFLGGAICPGLKLTSEALVSGTAKLPHIELIKPEHAIGKTTVANLQSGLIFGYVGLVEYLAKKLKNEMGHPDAKVIATGGTAKIIASESDCIDVVDGLLTLKGLRLIWEKNH